MKTSKQRKKKQKKKKKEKQNEKSRVRPKWHYFLISLHAYFIARKNLDIDMMIMLVEN